MKTAMVVLKRFGQSGDGRTERMRESVTKRKNLKSMKKSWIFCPAGVSSQIKKLTR